MLQRQVNVLNKKRVRELRKLAGEIGETAVGATALRTSGGYRFRSAQITRRLGVLFFIRLSIYRKKIFMKFLNNFLTQHRFQSQRRRRVECTHAWRCETTRSVRGDTWVALCGDVGADTTAEAASKRNLSGSCFA